MASIFPSTSGAPENCATCGRRLGQNAYAMAGSSGLYCSSACMAAAVKKPVGD